MSRFGWLRLKQAVYALKKLKKVISFSSSVQMYSDEQFRKAEIYDWSSAVAKQVLKKTKEYTMECWAADLNAKKIESVTKDGITYKRFPYIGPKPIYGFRGVSKGIISELRNERKIHNVLLHLHTYSSYVCYQALLAAKNTPVIGQHHGSTHPLRLLRRRPMLFPALPLLLAEELAEAILFQRIDHFFVLSSAEKKDLSRFVNPKKIEIQTMGVDFNETKPIDKIQARKNLHLPVDKKIIMYVGRFFEAKGVHKILDAFNKIKANDKSVFLVLIGGTVGDPFYERAQKEASLCIGKVKPDMIKYYLSAADVYVMYCNEAFRTYGGVGIAPLEALACNTPTVNTNLADFPKKDVNLVGRAPVNEDEFVRDIMYVLDHPAEFKNCRAIAKKYYDWSPIIDNTIKVYKRLFKQYYGM